MLVSEIATRVKRQFGDDLGAQISDADIIRWVNDAMMEIAVANNLLQIAATADTTAGTAEYDLPNDVLRLRAVKFKGVKLNGLTMEDFDNMLSEANGVSTGEPQAFYVYARKITLFPAPSANGTTDLKIFYNRTPTAVTVVGDTPEIPVQYHNRIVEYCIAQAAELDDNLEQYQLKMGMFKSSVETMKDDNTAEKFDTYPSITVSPRDYGGEYNDYVYMG
jgi:hypothetical protein